MNQLSYEKNISEQKRVSLGIVYTPQDIISHINESVLNLWKNDYPPKFLDPCCGTGLFLKDMAQRVSIRYNLPLKEVYDKYTYGADVDKEALGIASNHLPGSTLYNQDSLKLDFENFDLLITNPPYVRIQNLRSSQRDFLKENFEFCVGDTDIYMAFLEKIVKSNKISGLIFPNSWLKNKNAAKARAFVRENQRVCQLIDFKSQKVFKNASTYTNILIFDTEPVTKLKVGTSLTDLTDAKYKDVFLCNGSIITSPDDLDFVRKVSERKTKFLEAVDMSTGLATLCDSVFCLELIEQHKGSSTVAKRKKGSEKFKIESGVTRICIRAGDISKNKDKKYIMIYPYDNSGKKLIKEHDLVTNYPLAHKYLSDSKDLLKNRDKGKNSGYEWYEFGRSQGLKLINENKLVLSTMIKDKVCLKFSPAGTVFTSGYCLSSNGVLSLKEIENVVNSKDFLRWTKIFGKDFGNDWSGLSKETYKNYKI